MERMTATRQTALAACPRKHFYQFEIGLQPAKDGPAFSFGKAWHGAMESRSIFKDPEIALAAGVAQAGPDIPEDVAAIFAALLRGYFAVYGPSDPWVVTAVEFQFSRKIRGTSGWTSAGKVDQIATERGSDSFVVEYKTTGESIEASSPFWSRTRYNVQLLTYLQEVASIRTGSIDGATLDVVHKPILKRRMVPKLDAEGRKIVFDLDGHRATLKDGLTYRQTGGEGLTVQETIETPEAYSERIFQDIMSRTPFYYARREVPILSDSLAAFAGERLNAIRLIRFYRKAATKEARPERGWPRNCSALSCRGCPYAGPCLEDREIDVNHPPEGFKIAFHQELDTPEQEPTDV